MPRRSGREELSRAAVAKAMEQLPHFFSAMAADAWNRASSKYSWQLLGVTRDDIVYNKKSTWTITGLRKLFKEFSGQLETGQTSAIASALLCGKALCVCCWQHNKKSGLLSLRRDTLC